MARVHYFILLAAVISCHGYQKNGPAVRLAGGLASGTWNISTDGRAFAAFRGIPYAQPPVGKNRFRDPQKMKPWLGIWDASRFGSPCLQYDPFSPTEDHMIGSENCLFLNVYTPQLNAGASLPVVVFIHGGAFMYGSSSLYGPEHFMDRDVVFVTLNYRLGPLGFLSTEDDLIAGNMGLKDQAFALNWIKENILMFGGNPDSITLTGLSAGGASVHYQYLTPLSRGTFHRGIAISGSAFSKWTQQVKPLKKAITLASSIGCPIDVVKNMVECLRHRPAETIVFAQTTFFDWRTSWFTPFTPTVESQLVKQPFIDRNPYVYAKSGLGHKLPLMTSVTSEEGLYPAAAYQADPTLLDDLEQLWPELASVIFEYNDTLPLQLRDSVAQKIKEKYLGGDAVNQTTFPRLVQALSDRLFVTDVGKLAEVHAQTTGQPTYLYYYAFRGEKSLSNLMAGNNEDYGVSHADDFFHLVNFKGLPLERPDDVQMRNVLLDIYLSFANTGVPRAAGVNWTPVSPIPGELNYLEISGPNSMIMKTSADFGQRSFWDSLGFLENEKAYMLGGRDEL